MRKVVLDRMQAMFDDDNLSDMDGDLIVSFAFQVETLPDDELLDLYEFNVGFQG